MDCNHKVNGTVLYATGIGCDCGNRWALATAHRIQAIWKWICTWAGLACHRGCLAAVRNFGGVPVMALASAEQKAAAHL